MKGLLLKDWYAVKTYFRSFLLLYVIFIVSSCLVEGNTFFLYYPCILSGMIAMSLISYEEKEKWDVFAATLPYSRAQLVSSKYLITLIIGGVLALGVTAAQAGAMLWRHNFDVLNLLKVVSMLITMTLLPAALTLPFIYKFGSQKGRLAYYLVLGIACGLLVAVGTIRNMTQAPSPVASVNVLVFVVAVLVYLASWYISIHIY